MALIVSDRVGQVSTGVGQDALALTQGLRGYRDFSSVCEDDDTFYYAIIAVDANGNPSGAWETGLATYSADNVTRTTVHASSNDDELVDFATGKKHVYIDATAAYVAKASAAQYRANTATKLLETDKVWTAAEKVTLTQVAGSIALDLSTGINFALNLDASSTLQNPTNVKIGQCGFITISQIDSYSLSYGTNWEFDGASAPTNSLTSGDEDVLYYCVLSATRIHGTLRKDLG